MVAPADVVKFVGAWQASQGAPAMGICVAGGPVAWTPLWQEAHPEVTPA